MRVEAACALAFRAVFVVRALCAAGPARLTLAPRARGRAFGSVVADATAYRPTLRSPAGPDLRAIPKAHVHPARFANTTPESRVSLGFSLASRTTCGLAHRRSPELAFSRSARRAGSSTLRAQAAGPPHLHFRAHARMVKQEARLYEFNLRPFTCARRAPGPQPHLHRRG